MLVIESNGIGKMYTDLIEALLDAGQEVLIGRVNVKTKEILGVQIRLENCLQNILYHPVRDLNYRFLLAEWLWIMSGRNDLATIRRYNSRYQEYSDDGITLAGAYGPRLWTQWGYVLQTLLDDPSSRQAVASIWTPNPPKSKDIPCTLNVQFLIREGKMHGIFNMRSSDAWLGIPHDVFAFCQMINAMAGATHTEPGSLILNLGSSHLYANNFELAEKLARRPLEVEDYLSPKLEGMGLMFAEDILYGEHPPLFHNVAAGYWEALRTATKAGCLEILKGMSHA